MPTTTAPLVIQLSGDFDVYNTDKLRLALAPALHHTHVIVDFTRVQYLDSTALTVLVRMRKRRAVAGMPPARFVGLNANLRRLFEITQLDQIWPIFSTIEEAMSGKNWL